MVKGIFTPDPEYSDKSRKHKVSGEILLGVIVGADGRVESACIQKSLTPDLDERELNTVRTWRFEPSRTPAGTATRAKATIMVAFKTY